MYLSDKAVMLSGGRAGRETVSALFPCRILLLPAKRYPGEEGFVAAKANLSHENQKSNTGFDKKRSWPSL